MTEQSNTTICYEDEISLFLRESFELSQEQDDEMVPQFIETLKNHVGNLETSFVDGDVSSVKKIGHTLKGALLNLGINDLAEIAKQIEHHDDSMEFAECQSKIEQLASAIQSI